MNSTWEPNQPVRELLPCLERESEEEREGERGREREEGREREGGRERGRRGQGGGEMCHWHKEYLPLDLSRDQSSSV